MAAPIHSPLPITSRMNATGLVDSARSSESSTISSRSHFAQSHAHARPHTAQPQRLGTSAMITRPNIAPLYRPDDNIIAHGKRIIPQKTFIQTSLDWRGCHDAKPRDVTHYHYRIEQHQQQQQQEPIVSPSRSQKKHTQPAPNSESTRVSSKPIRATSRQHPPFQLDDDREAVAAAAYSRAWETWAARPTPFYRHDQSTMPTPAQPPHESHHRSQSLVTAAIQAARNLPPTSTKHTSRVKEGSDKIGFAPHPVIEIPSHEHHPRNNLWSSDLYHFRAHQRAQGQWASELHPHAWNSSTTVLSKPTIPTFATAVIAHSKPTQHTWISSSRTRTPEPMFDHSSHAIIPPNDIYGTSSHIASVAHRSGIPHITSMNHPQREIDISMSAPLYSSFTRDKQYHPAQLPSREKHRNKSHDMYRIQQDKRWEEMEDEDKEQWMHEIHEGERDRLVADDEEDDDVGDEETSSQDVRAEYERKYAEDVFRAASDQLQLKPGSNPMMMTRPASAPLARLVTSPFSTVDRVEDSRIRPSGSGSMPEAAAEPHHLVYAGWQRDDRDDMF